MEFDFNRQYNMIHGFAAKFQELATAHLVHYRSMHSDQ
jgi:hypothetical protein